MRRSFGARWDAKGLAPQALIGRSFRPLFAVLLRFAAALSVARAHRVFVAEPCGMGLGSAARLTMLVMHHHAT